MNREKAKSVSKLIAKCVLAAIAAGGIVAFFGLMPGLAEVLRPFVGRRRYCQNEEFYPKYARQIIKRLEKRGLVKILEKNRETMLRITKLGKKQLEQWQLGKLKIVKPKRWDGRWRIVIFDIPEKRRGVRDLIRDELRNLEFYYMQNSVWVYPYECEDVVLAIAKAYDLLPYIIYIEADYVGNDTRLRRNFRI